VKGLSDQVLFLYNFLDDAFFVEASTSSQQKSRPEIIGTGFCDK